MSCERALKKRVLDVLRKYDPVSVENSVYPGTPDVNFADGWIELKHVKKYPARGGPIRIPHFTPQQRVWLKRRWHAGGRAFLLLQIEHDYYLFDGCTASSLLGTANREKLEEHARFMSDGYLSDCLPAVLLEQYENGDCICGVKRGS